MAYIGQSPSIGNFQVCDAISVVNGQAAYTMQVSSVNVVPETANHMIVSLNGIIQAPGSSYTVAGSTITFASNLVTGDVINFIHILGSVLDLGVPSDDTVSTAKISANAVTAAKFNADVISGQTALASEPADTDEFLVSDAGVLKRIDYSLIKGGGGLVLISSTNVTSGVSNVQFTSGIDSTYAVYKVFISGAVPASDNLDMQLFLSRDGGSSYESSNYTFTFFSKDGDGNDGAENSTSASRILLSGDNVGNASNETFSSEITLFNASSTSQFITIDYSSTYFEKNNLIVTQHGAASFKGDAGAINAIKFAFDGGNINSGRFSLYGITHS